MADTPQIYFTTLTAVGEAKDAKAKALGTALKFTAMAVGDGNGALPVPDRTRTALVREVRRAAINTLKQDPQNPAQLIAEHAGRETAELYGPPDRLAEARALAESEGLTVRPAGPAIAIVGSENAINGAVPDDAIRRAATLEDVFVILTGEEAE